MTNRGALAEGEGVTDLKLGPRSSLRVVDGLLTGFHEPGSSHYRLLQAFAPLEHLDAAHAHAAERGFLYHEFGDSLLVLPNRTYRREAGKSVRVLVGEGFTPSRVRAVARRLGRG